MQFLSHLTESPLLQRIGWTLVHSTWMLALIGIVLSLLLALLRNRSANGRYTFAYGGLVLMAAAPAFVFFGSPAYQEKESIAALPERSIVNARSEQENKNAVVNEFHAAPRIEEEIQPPTQGKASENKTLEFEEQPGTHNLASQNRLEAIAPWLSLIWMAGVLLLSVWRGGGWWTAQRMKRLGCEPASDSLSQTVDQLQQLLGMSVSIRTLQSTIVKVPMVIGCFKPTLLLPVYLLESLTGAQLRMVVAHELAHIRRHDYLANLVQTVIETLLFFHPAVWWLSRRIRLERENCCDDLAVQYCGNGIDLAKALLAVESSKNSATAELALAATGGDTLSRVRRLLGTASGRGNRFSLIPASLILGIAVFALPGFLTVPQTQADNKKPQWGPSNNGLRMRLTIGNREGADASIHDIRIEIANRRKTPVTFLVPSSSVSGDVEQSRELKAYVQGNVVFDCRPASVPRETFSVDGPLSIELDGPGSQPVRFGVLHRKVGPIAPGETMTVNWVETGFALGEANGYPRFNRSGRYEIEARLTLKLNDDKLDNNEQVELVSNPQAYIAGGSNKKPQRGTAKLSNVDPKTKTARLDAGANDGLRAGDKFSWHAKGGGWDLTVTKVTASSSVVKLTYLERPAYGQPWYPQDDQVVPLDIPRLNCRPGPRTTRWSHVDEGLAVGIRNLKPEIAHGQAITFSTVLRNFGNKAQQVAPMKPESFASGIWRFEFQQESEDGRWLPLYTGVASPTDTLPKIELLSKKSVAGKVLLDDAWNYRDSDDKVLKQLPPGNYQLDVLYYDAPPRKKTPRPYPRIATWARFRIVTNAEEAKNHEKAKIGKTITEKDIRWATWLMPVNRKAHGMSVGEIADVLGPPPSREKLRYLLKEFAESGEMTLTDVEETIKLLGDNTFPANRDLDTVIAREWKSEAGDRKWEAEFVRLNGENVVLKQKDGKQAVVPLKRLTEKDRAVAMEYEKLQGLWAIEEIRRSGKKVEVDAPNAIWVMLIYRSKMSMGEMASGRFTPYPNPESNATLDIDPSHNPSVIRSSRQIFFYTLKKDTLIFYGNRERAIKEIPKTLESERDNEVAVQVFKRIPKNTKFVAPKFPRLRLPIPDGGESARREMQAKLLELGRDGISKNEATQFSFKVCAREYPETVFEISKCDLKNNIWTVSLVGKTGEWKGTIGTFEITTTGHLKNATFSHK